MQNGAFAKLPSFENDDKAKNGLCSKVDHSNSVGGGHCFTSKWQLVDKTVRFLVYKKEIKMFIEEVNLPTWTTSSVAMSFNSRLTILLVGGYSSRSVMPKWKVSQDVWLSLIGWKKNKQLVKWNAPHVLLHMCSNIQTHWICLIIKMADQ